ncbi:ABC transporter permease [Halobacteriales archaeon Cl-PHB]
MSNRTETSQTGIEWETLEEEWEDELEETGDSQGRLSRYRTTFSRLASYRLSIAGGILIGLLVVTAIFAPLIAPADPATQDVVNNYAPPSVEHPMGTDSLGRDVLSRIIHGTRITIQVAVLAMGIAFAVGSILGALAGYYGGRVDTVVQTAIDLTWAFPAIIVGLSLAAILEPNLGTILAAIALVYWGIFARLVRGEVLSLREQEYVKSARAIGLSDLKIIGRHILPNAIVPAFVVATLQMGNAIAVEASLSFLGLGVQPPTPSWGIMLADGRQYMRTAWWISTFPGLAIVAVILAFNLLGEGLRDTLDPKLRQE